MPSRIGCRWEQGPNPQPIAINPHTTIPVNTSPQMPHRSRRNSPTMSSSSSSGIGFSGLLTVLFIGLKLTGHITWPWIWVLSPLWISVLIGITFIALLLVLAAIFGK